MMKHRDYQVRINTVQDNFMADPVARRGQIYLATGGGKTVCFTDLILKLVTGFTVTPKKILIVHPRLALSANQQKRLKKSLRGLGIEFTGFHSGKVYHTLDDRKNISTRSRAELVQIQADATGPHITFSSYKSLSKIADLDFDVIICDEAHYLVQSDHRKNLSKFNSKVLFYTGTPINVVAQEESMDNVELFGPVLAAVPPRELIPYGYIVPPRLRYLDAVTKKHGNTVDYPSTIATAYKDQHSLAHKSFVHKMLVVMPNTKKFDDIMKNLHTIRTNVGIFDLDLYFITAGRAVKNGIEFIDREVALDDFDDNPNPCIIIHCDTLAEGIDIDGIGGIIMFRSLSKTKTLQTIGRGCRAAEVDIKKNGEIRKNRIKTHCIVTLVRIDGEWHSGVRADEWAEMFAVSGYGDIMDLIDPDGPAAGGGEPDPKDPEATVWDEFAEVKITSTKLELYEKLFGMGE